ncbi:MAG: exodeoxyribonuclease VII small subunit [Gammaproteobacteria bacterium]|nr:exodeoxyribonuclease VII small subunit [Gammaproteobacteria bacterium]NIR85680.1 exodeoxyribonuclease VII small subunit [Gammaproteobacteria bacterium]NIR90213.1 exodeoxyribonuclease VII small subunit [Gammaproteobacteria bacterium]NIU06814.1 exodeoxyribonuclease VII small subunit [Gammaproteobacteria bacterium]NIV53747.1 exodeoxyribonuclease VII small subunit [Gammaproteobacteria bacterium]
MASDTNALNFEKALEEFERLVERMEEGDLSLEESLKTYERGIELSRICQRALDEAEQRIQILTDPEREPEAPAPDPDD